LPAALGGCDGTIWEPTSQRLGQFGGGTLQERVQSLEQALQECKHRNNYLVKELQAQREKTRALYQRTKEYAMRLKSKQ
jgi:hypothetical protein